MEESSHLYNHIRIALLSSNKDRAYREQNRGVHCLLRIHRVLISNQLELLKKYFATQHRGEKSPPRPPNPPPPLLLNPPEFAPVPRPRGAPRNDIFADFWWMGFFNS